MQIWESAHPRTLQYTVRTSGRYCLIQKQVCEHRPAFCCYRIPRCCLHEGDPRGTVPLAFARKGLYCPEFLLWSRPKAVSVQDMDCSVAEAGETRERWKATCSVPSASQRLRPRWQKALGLLKARRSSRGARLAPLHPV